MRAEAEMGVSGSARTEGAASRAPRAASEAGGGRGALPGASGGSAALPAPEVWPHVTPFQTSGLQNCKKIDVCRRKPPRLTATAGNAARNSRPFLDVWFKTIVLKEE